MSGAAPLWPFEERRKPEPGLPSYMLVLATQMLALQNEHGDNPRWWQSGLHGPDHCVACRRARNRIPSRER